MGPFDCPVSCQVPSGVDSPKHSDRAEKAGSVEERAQRFDAMVGKVVERWNYGLSQMPGGLDLSGFVKLIGADRVGDYIRITHRYISDGRTTWVASRAI